MLRKEFQGKQLSLLGLGCMRLPVINGDDAVVDQAAVEEMVALAMEQGVNYYDTAWAYHGGNSERAIGKALSAYPRDKFYLADKFPGFDLENMSKVQEIFEEQLRKCQVDYFDFYLFHNVCEANIDGYLDPHYGVMDYLLEQKKNGRIRHLGFSCHGKLPVLKRFLEAYGEHLEFCQLQLNYIDWTYRDGKEKVDMLQPYHIPVWVMEPLRGGRLARLSETEAAVLRAMAPQRPIPAWAFRFLQSIPEVTMVLSGMSAPDPAGMGPSAGPGQGDDRSQGAGLHQLPVLHQPLPAGAGYPPPAGDLQRSPAGRRRFPRPRDLCRDPGGQAAQRLHRLPQLRGRVPPAAEDRAGHGRLQRHAVTTQTGRDFS